MPDRSFSEEIFPKIQSEPPLMQLEAIASRPTASYLGEETNNPPTTTAFQVVLLKLFSVSKTVGLISFSSSFMSQH